MTTFTPGELARILRHRGILRNEAVRIAGLDNIDRAFTEASDNALVRLAIILKHPLFTEYDQLVAQIEQRAQRASDVLWSRWQPRIYPWPYGHKEGAWELYSRIKANIQRYFKAQEDDAYAELVTALRAITPSEWLQFIQERVS